MARWEQGALRSRSTDGMLCRQKTAPCFGSMARLECLCRTRPDQALAWANLYRELVWTAEEVVDQAAARELALQATSATYNPQTRRIDTADANVARGRLEAHLAQARQSATASARAWVMPTADDIALALANNPQFVAAVAKKLKTTKKRHRNLRES